MSRDPGFRPPETFNVADYLLDQRIGEGLGGRPALHTDAGVVSYDEVHALSNRLGNHLRSEGIAPEQRVAIALPDGAEFVAALFGTLKVGAVAVMVNPHQRADALRDLLEYIRATAVLVDPAVADAFAGVTAQLRDVPRLLVLDDARRTTIAAASAELETAATHRDDAAIWLFSGGTSGRPKAVVQTHRSYANTTELYGKRVLGLTQDDVTISVPKLFFGYAMGSNLFFPFSVGGSAVLFGERCTPDVLFDRIERHRPTVLVNVPTMVQQMVAHPAARSRDVSSLRLATSAGEALPVELYRRWRDMFGVELLDGLGTAEMWHIFISNRPDDVKPGTIGRVVDGFDVRLRDDEGRDVDVDEAGYLWVRGDSRAIAYWRDMDATRRAFRGPWYVSEDMLSRDADGYYTYRGRADDMLKVAGKWLAPQEVENCLLQHAAVREVAVVGAVQADGLTRPHACVVTVEPHDDATRDRLAAELLDFVRERIDSYKVPRTLVFLDELPRTHLGKVDRGRLRSSGE
jgi:benzoate-CoA ligase family protein